MAGKYFLICLASSLILPIVAVVEQASTLPTPSAAKYSGPRILDQRIS
jgi:hypothetical protein